MTKVQVNKECSIVKSPLWEGNGYRLPICNDCLNFLYGFYFRALGNEYDAYRRICMKFDIYYHNAIVDSALKNDASTDRIAPYIGQLNFARYQGKTYDNTIEEEANEEAPQPSEEPTTTVSIETEIEEKIDPELELFFGLGFKQKEYAFMDTYYTAQMNEIPESCREALDETVRDMSRFKALQARGFESGIVDEIDKYSTLFQKSLKYKDDYIAKYKKTESSTTEDLTMSNLTEMIENFCPADVYRNKGVFQDVDRIKDYFTRFVARPLKNFFTGSREMDKEFNVNGYNEDE
ncbi:MAG: hypothetical protein NC084_06270 [Bacteroides sp.]|nr:hypothetical protein [Eubacterium sp.]MCM1418169.1 hypothetical protein [Roseburia sp.]MCM1462306.1 hypothetical protein [Bacteroides sp.]